MKKKICLVTGGTGGHIYPALALASKWREMDDVEEIFFIGNDDRMEATLVPSYDYPFYALHTSGLVGGFFSKAKAILQLVKAYSVAKKYLKQKQPNLVVGFGGYVCAPVILAAHSLKIPTMIHEQNSIVGKSNKVVMNKVDKIVTCYEKCSEVFPMEKTVLLGNPRGTIAKEAEFDQEYFKSLGLSMNRKTILIMMGSLGSSSVNELMKDALKNVDFGLQFLYVCGKDNDKDLDLFKGKENIVVVPYVDTLKIYGKIDGMICRAGATTLAEVTALGIPSILIPSPYVANNHQFYNASMLVQKNAARMIEEKDLNAQTLEKAIKDLFGDEKAMAETRNCALALGKPNAAYDMIELANQIL